MRLVVPLVAMVVMVVALLAAYWAFLTLTIDQPYDEMWIGLNARLPEPLRAWSCGEVAGRLGEARGIAPFGCEGLW